LRNLTGALWAAAVLAACAAVERPPALPAAALAGADSIRSAPLAPGVRHVSFRDAAGPWAVHLVAVDRRVCEPVLESRKPPGTLAGRAPTTSLAAGAVATINADFFRLPGGTPVGAHVSGGVPLIGATDWPVFAVTMAGEWATGSARVEGAVRVHGDSATIMQINRRAESFTAYPGTAEGITLFTARADTLPADSAAAVARLRLLSGDEARGTGVVVATDTVALATVLGAGGVVLRAHGSARDWIRRRSAGDTVTWVARVAVHDPAGRRVDVVREAVGGFPLLLYEGREMLATQTVRDAFGLARHPRTAIGWTDDGQLYLVAVDGRQPPWSDGMTLPELTALFRRLGATTALNLDGGGSTALVIGSELVNRPSDVEGERPVGNALALAGCAAPRR
jgi:exopolysaccharide biosynthesis protein